MDDQNRNLLLAMVLSTAVLFVWWTLFPPPEPSPVEETAVVGTDGQAILPSADAGTDAAASTGTPSNDTAIAPAEVERVSIDTPSLSGSISMSGGRIDTLSLKNYQQTLAAGSGEVPLLSPVGTEQPYYVLFGWVPGGNLGADDVPGSGTVWSIESGGELTPESPVTLRWDSASGLIFRRTISVDDEFMFSVTQTVENPTSDTVRLAPYGIVAREGEPQDLMGFFIIHEGAIRMSDGELEEIDYSDMPDLGNDPVWGASTDVIDVTENGWAGFTDHYWMTALIPEEGKAFTSVAQYVSGADVYRTMTRQQTLEVAAGTTVSAETQVFAGAKEWETIRDYEAGRKIEGFLPSLSYFFGFSDQTGVNGFTDSIDWGWFYFLTKPIFFVLHELNELIGNMGWAIIALTLLIKALLFPLARKSYVSMAKMKELQPEMEKIKERVGDDRQKLQTEMMGLYKK
ncbi:MAG: membrane protein insertase YidC, partial [Boseongicola sp.]|nr:membrane protein insertase YidC [Boseongicola sp.]